LRVPCPPALSPYLDTLAHVCEALEVVQLAGVASKGIVDKEEKKKRADNHCGNEKGERA